MSVFCSADTINYFIDKARESEEKNPYEARAWLLTGVSIAPTCFQLQLQAYTLEKRLGNVEETAANFVHLFRKFVKSLDDEICELANAVRAHHMSKGKETSEHLFLLKVFEALPKEVQVEVLMLRSEQSTVQFEKCQFMLLFVKLYPEIADKNKADILWNMLDCESDVYSTFRRTLVVELVPAVLKMKKSLGLSPRLLTLLNQCIEYYTLVPSELVADNEDSLEITCKRWDELFGIVDQIGSNLGWKLCPFFTSNSHGSIVALETYYQALSSAFQHWSHYTIPELAYILMVLFLRSIVIYYQLSNYSDKNFGERSRLQLVQVFLPEYKEPLKKDSSSSIITFSPCSSIGPHQAAIGPYFRIACKLWQLLRNGNPKGNKIEKEFYSIIESMKSININKWEPFQDFSIDYRIYNAQHFAPDSETIKNPIKLASLHCSAGNYIVAAENALKAVEIIAKIEIQNANEIGNTSSFVPSMRSHEDYSFFHSADICDAGNRRLHFVSENKHEILLYVTNILIHCFQALLETSKDDTCAGHLLTLIQIEWPSNSAELIMKNILQLIRRRGSFSYSPFFNDFVIEPDFLEEFMAIANNDSKTVVLDIFGTGVSVTGPGSRRMATRGVVGGAKNDFKQSMKRQMMRSSRENIENVIFRFLSERSVEILDCIKVNIS